MKNTFPKEKVFLLKYNTDYARLILPVRFAERRQRVQI